MSEQRPYVPLDAFTHPRDHSSRVVPLWVDGRPPYELTVSVHTLAFGGQQVGVKGDPLILKITNSGFQPLHIESILIVGDTFEMSPVAPHVIEGGGGVTLVPVVFRPPEFGVHYGKLVITTKEKVNKEVRLIGSGIWDYVSQVDNAISNLWAFLQRATRPALTTNGPIMDLGNTGVEFKQELIVGEEQADFNYVVSNAGNQPLIINNLIVTGDFEIIP